MAKTNKTAKAPAKKRAAAKSKTTVTDQPQSETSLMHSPTGQAWERGESVPCAKNESK